jgi:hypothetical protein
MVKDSNTRQQITFRKTELVKIRAEAKRRGLTLTKFINQILREADVI